MTWPQITFLALWALTSLLLVFMQAATPSTERASSGDLILSVGIASVVAGMVTTMIVGVVAIATGAV